MFPVLLEIGPIVIRTLNLFFALSLITGLFVFWRKGREEHYDEMMLFDGILLSLANGFLISRITFILFHFERFGSNIISWLDVVGSPGFTLWVFLVISGFYMIRYAKKHKWDVYEILDFWSLGVVTALGFIWLGYFLGGGAMGTPTSMPWGIISPGVFEKLHPVSLYYTAFFAILGFYLSWVEYRYRTFTWYRAGKNTAQTGFLISVFLLFTGLMVTLMNLFTISTATLAGFRLDLVGGLTMLVLGGFLLLNRSGRHFSPFKRKSAASKLEEFSV